MSYAVTATFKGERVYLGEHAYPRQVLLTLSFDPVTHAHDDARRIEASAHRDETLHDVKVEAL